MKINNILIIAILFLSIVIPMINAVECVESISGAYISCVNDECKYGVNQPIQNITITITSEVLTKIDDVPIEIKLCKKDTACTGGDLLKKITNAITDSNGKVYIGSGNYNLDFTPTKSMELVLKIIVEPNGVNFKLEKNITVTSSLELILNCPAQGYINREVKCEWNTYVAGTSPKEKKEPSPIISIVQGDTELDKTPTTTSVTFVPNKTGSVDVTVTVNLEGYLGDTKTAQIEIDDPVLGQTLLVDNKDFFLFTGVGIDAGTHQLKFKVDESGKAIPVQDIEATIRTPSGQTTTLTFNEKQGEWITTYNFEQEGQTYQLSGKMIFEDKEDLLFEYNIVTTAGATVEYKNTVTYIIIGVSVGVFIVIVVLIVIFRKGKKSIRR